ncbi:hypothetical protein E2C01_075973 [Portunus trituberculatus]|uniref:Uncharacterized protein n=1 Tax=Portunus trituberculatus TaxID=210409 RepID=A0A5B7I7I7_PORTR|nr:hypothetical protein [Portunus trituberculatus]
MRQLRAFCCPGRERICWVSLTPDSGAGHALPISRGALCKGAKRGRGGDEESPSVYRDLEGVTCRGVEQRQARGCRGELATRHYVNT